MSNIDQKISDKWGKLNKQTKILIASTALCITASLAAGFADGIAEGLKIEQEKYENANAEIVSTELEKEETAVKFANNLSNQVKNDQDFNIDYEALEDFIAENSTPKTAKRIEINNEKAAEAENERGQVNVAKGIGIAGAIGSGIAGIHAGITLALRGFYKSKREKDNLDNSRDYRDDEMGND